MPKKVKRKKARVIWLLVHRENGIVVGFKTRKDAMQRASYWKDGIYTPVKFVECLTD